MDFNNPDNEEWDAVMFEEKKIKNIQDEEGDDVQENFEEPEDPDEL